jgi:hypothetical protein
MVGRILEDSQTYHTDSYVEKSAFWYVCANDHGAQRKNEGWQDRDHGQSTATGGSCIIGIGAY